MDFFGKKYNLLPGDDRKRKLSDNQEVIESWEGNLTSDDALLQKQRDLSELVPERNINHLHFIYVICSLLAIVLLFRLWQLQVVKGEESLKKAEGNIIHVKTVYAPRGVIYDRDSVVLAGNKARYDLKVVPAMMSTDNTVQNKIYQQISDVTNIEPSIIKGKAEKDGLNNWQEIVIIKDLDRNQALLLKTKQLPGFFIENISSRQYYCDNECAHLVGYTGSVTEEDLKNENYQPIDQIGKSGLEIFYESNLKGINGAEYRIVDANGEITSILTPKQSKPGNNIKTTIDGDLQKYLYEKLAQQVNTREKSTGGAVVVTDPNSGEILAMVSYPAFSSNAMTKGMSEEDYQKLINDQKLPLFNRAVSGEYPPGSTFKIVTAASILNENITSPETTINDQGSIRIVNKYDPSIVYIFYSWNHAGLGPVNLVDALTLSSDIYFYVFGGGFENYEGLGNKRLVKNAEKFNLSKKTGIDLFGERAGFLPTPEWKQAAKNEQWYLGDDYNTAIGQGDILTTPLQVNGYTEAIANGGKIYRPHLLKQVLDEDGKVLIDKKPEIIAQDMISPENIAILKEGLEAVVSRGTAKILQSAKVKVAGKTGTAQFANNEKEHAWFTGYAPTDNPQIAFTVFVEGGGEGSDTAAPIALDLVNYYFK